MNNQKHVEPIESILDELGYILFLIESKKDFNPYSNTNTNTYINPIVYPIDEYITLLFNIIDSIKKKEYFTNYKEYFSIENINQKLISLTEFFSDKKGRYIEFRYYLKLYIRYTETLLTIYYKLDKLKDDNLKNHYTTYLKTLYNNLLSIYKEILNG